MNSDIAIYICQFLDDWSKLQLLSINRKLHMIKNKVYYNQMTNMSKIYYLWYRDQMTNIFTHDIYYYTLPKNVTHITFTTNFDKDIKAFIPHTVTYLKFGSRFDRCIKDCIPESVTYLEFGKCFNQNIKDCIPNGVTVLKFGRYFNQNIRDCIPNGVTVFGIWSRF